jgi:hypothetical protein
MKMEAVSDSSQTQQNCTLFITSYFPITFTRMEPYIYPATTTREEGTEEEEE